MIDIRKLKELVRLMVENDLSEIDLRDQEEKVTVKRGQAGVPMVQMAPMSAPMAAGAPTEHASSVAAAKAEPSNDAGLLKIESPMVGTYYASPNPDAPAYITVGAEISEGSVVCLIEAMKVFNEIKSEISGTVERILVKNGQAVEFGEPILLVRPN